MKTMENGDDIKWLALYSLSSDYSIAAFDYDILLIRNTDQITLISNATSFNSVDENVILKLLKEHIVFKEGKIYEMDRDECPLIYASKANPASSFATLKIIKDL